MSWVLSKCQMSREFNSNTAQISDLVCLFNSEIDDLDNCTKVAASNVLRGFYKL